MTFSIIGRCKRTGAFGAAISTSNLAVGHRCIRLAHGKGAVLSQHRTDTRLAELGIELLRDGRDAGDTLDEICASTDQIEWRQVGVLDADGRAKAYHGRRMYSIYTHTAGRDCLALGNILDNDEVTTRMAETFENTDGEPLGERLMRALEAGRDAGGEVKDALRSAALRVTGEHGIDACDLRVDISETDAIADLRKLYTAFNAEAELMRDMALDPDRVPVSRALFDASAERIFELGLETRFPAARNPDNWTFR
ncbi:DUF1028 domain-containing protein [Roseovarius sp. SCSIO 43702]|uniref:DUF1028 domain-containing protein n=1 Tax=Roseovarius sp. SCSIO 43702 TaxID=2823043 RepID=UPI001C734BB8|nr:DUF1028 domain-containing protein [Roseovarius sp. SCSIO 43702]QYX56184.1 DUF1028 domain-containing protein [Roseovarius sp. SCSIO 43702]